MADSPAELQAEVDKLLRRHEENPEGRFFVPLANAFRKLGELEHAEGFLREGLRKHPDYLSAHIVLGRCLADRGANAEAAGEFRYVLSVDPHNLIALRTLGELADAEGDTREAERWFRELLAVDPMNDEARLALEGLTAGRTAEPEQQESAEDPLDGGGWWVGPETGEEEELSAVFDAAPADGGIADEAELPEWDGSSWLADDAVVLADERTTADDGAPPLAAEGLLLPDHAGDLGGADVARPEGMMVDDGATAWGTAADEPAPDGFDAIDAEPFPLAASAIGDDADGAADEEADVVVTETIAELYATQGIYDRAADVYRQLIARRGQEPALVERMAQLDRLAAGGAPPPSFEPTTAADPGPAEFDAGGFDTGDLGATALPELDDVEFDTVGFAGAPAFGGDEAGAEAGSDPWMELPSVPAETEAEPSDATTAAPFGDPFADSFASGFVGDAPTRNGDGAHAGPDDAEPYAATEAAADAEGTAEPEGADVPAPVTVTAFFAGLLAWRPTASASTMEAEAGPDSAYDEPAGAVAEPEPGAADDAEDEALPWLDDADAFLEPVSESSADDAVDAGPAPAADAASGGTLESDLMPWEETPADAFGSGGDAAPAAAGGEAEFSYEEFFAEPSAEPAPAEAPTPERLPETPAQQPRSGAAGAGEEDDEDLESFQAWLRSLKR